MSRRCVPFRVRMDVICILHNFHLSSLRYGCVSDARNGAEIPITLSHVEWNMERLDFYVCIYREACYVPSSDLPYLRSAPSAPWA